jgi:anti-sigma28 factor (negative regulator of flagellin synthesis)
MAKSQASVEVESGTTSEDVRWEKVFEVRAAISEGRYIVSAQDLAEKLLKLMRDGRDVLGYQLCFDDKERTDALQK